MGCTGPRRLCCISSRKCELGRIHDTDDEMSNEKDTHMDLTGRIYRLMEHCGLGSGDCDEVSVGLEQEWRVSRDGRMSKWTTGVDEEIWKAEDSVGEDIHTRTMKGSKQAQAGARERQLSTGCFRSERLPQKCNKGNN